MNNFITVKIKSESQPGVVYDVMLSPYGWRCSCPYYKNRLKQCKHFELAFKEIKIVIDAALVNKNEETIIHG